jgi:hypothetical protein
MAMTLEDALDIVSSETERSLVGLGHGVDRNKIKWALEMVESAVLKFIKIEKKYNQLSDKLESNSDAWNNGMSSFVTEDDNVRSES